MSTKKSTYTYPIFTVRWLSVHALAVPTVFFFRCNYSNAIYSTLKFILMLNITNLLFTYFYFEGLKQL